MNAAPRAEIDDTYAEAFRSIYAEVLITARDRVWVDHAVNAVTGNASSTILCDCEAGLDRYLDSNPPLAERLRVIQRVAEALGFAHSQGVLHRDLKPQNVMVGAFGEVYVMDWGVEAVAGTPAFRAPEGAAGPRSGDSSTIMCAFVPPTPSEFTAARRG